MSFRKILCPTDFSEGSRVALRLALAYGPGAPANMARLVALARSPMPLPFGSLKARRSLLSLDNLVAAIDCVINVQEPLRRPLIVADPEPLTVAEMIAAMRRALGRRPGLLPVPPRLLELLMRAARTVVRRDELARGALGRSLLPFDRSIDVHVSRVRKKLGPRPDGGERITTLRAVGYLYTRAGEPSGG